MFLINLMCALCHLYYHILKLLMFYHVFMLASMKSLLYILLYYYNPLYGEAVIKLQKTCHTINYSTDPPQYMSLDREGIPDLPVESMLNIL